jgi:hypothetical protein
MREDDMRRAWVFLATLLLIGCGGGGLPTPAAPTDAPTAVVPFRASLAPATPLRIVINEYRPRLDPQTAQRCTPYARNDHFAAVDVTLINNGAKPLSLSWTYASLSDAQGRQYADKGCDHMLPPDFPSVMTLQQGEQVRGWMSFQLPSDAAPTRYRYDDGSVSVSIPLA